MNRLIACTLLLSACWPYITDGRGKPADTTVVIGQLSYTRFLGAYWEPGTTPQLSTWVATVDPPQNIFMIEYYGLTQGMCQHNAALPSWWGAFATNGSGAANIASDAVAISAPWDPASFRFVGDAAGTGVESGSWWTASGVNSGPYGAYVVDNAVYLPSDITISSPAIAGATLTTLPFADIPVAWSGGGDADEVVIVLQLRDSTGGLLEILECRAPNTGSFQVPVSTTMTQWSNAAQGLMVISAVHQQDAEVDFLDGAGTRMLGSNSFVGAFNTQ